MEFRSQTVADALERDVRWVGEQCDELVRQQHWIGHVALEGLPGGSLDASYAFRHALYRHVFYQRIGALARAQYHRHVALSMERSRAAGVSVTAAELASHYDLGHDPMAALRHYGDAADSAGSTQILCYAAEARIAAACWSEAQAHVDEALQLARGLGERVRIPDLLLLQARIALGQGQVDAARTSMRDSLEEARAQRALGLELAALVALCELENAAAADLHALEDACGRVTEGFDTALVARARELVAPG
jgi:hypothetical protein